MANLNKVMLIGNLTRDPEMRMFANGGKVAKFGFAVNNRKKNASTGVWENVKSPAHYLNRDRYATTTPPADANKSATPEWVKLADGNTAVWHDHRTHWMSPVPPPAIEANRGVEQTVPGDHHLALTVDGRPVSALVSIVWIPPPNRTAWLALTSLAGCLMVFLLDRRRAVVPWCALLATLAAVCVHGGGVQGTIVTAAVAVIALAAAIRQWRVVSAVTAAIAAAYGFVRIDSFSHALVAGTLTNSWARVAVAVSLGMGCAVVGAIVIEKISPARTDEVGRPATPR